VSVARALYRLDRVGARLLLVDEPSSALDRVTEARVVEGLRRIAATGVAVVVVTHRRAVSDAADVVVPIGGPS
jgi:ATP-binding cassette subfamily C protein CydD